MKVLQKKAIRTTGELQNTLAERNILMKIRHPFLMRLHYAFQTTQKLALVMDFVNGGDLFHHLQLQKPRRFDNERAAFYAAEIALGIMHLHEKGILYRDLKPENILIDSDGHIRLTDFGLSKEGFYKKMDRTNTFCGTPEYLAPEVLAGGNYNNAVDWWGFGALIYEMLTGWAPFYTKDVQKMYKLKTTARIGVPDYVSPDAKKLILRLLDRNPDTRLTDPDKIKAHPWFSGINWDQLLRKEVEPPFKPQLTSSHSIEMFDQDFIQKSIESEIGVTDQTIEDGNDEMWKDYTYVDEDIKFGGSWTGFDLHRQEPIPETFQSYSIPTKSGVL
uniref:Protein kinase domain-containing protein n=1 Tax=Arcella intermedia TaxID=1963864 RepID=A0A6B2L8U3_9EUKA